MSIAAELTRKARRDAGLTQQALAQRMGVSQPVVARLERDGANPTFRVFAAAISATGSSLAIVPAGTANVDHGLVQGRLQQSPADRLMQFERALADVQAFARAGEQARRAE